MFEFKVGDKVICITDNNYYDFMVFGRKLQKGDVLTISSKARRSSNINGYWYGFKEEVVHNGMPNWGSLEKYFELFNLGIQSKRVD